MSILALILVASAGVLAIILPWVGVLAYYTFAIMQAHHLWPEHFGDGRVSLIITASTLLGLCLATVMKQVNWRILFTPYSLLVMLLIVMVNLSVHFSGFVFYADAASAKDIAGILTQAQVIETFNKIMVFYIIASLLIDNRVKLEYCLYALAVVVLYYTFWANKIYLTGEFWRFGDNGRLNGPINSVYFDENYLGMLFVVATPLLYYIGVVRSNPIVKYAIWLTIPLSWHALFLTGSRGGILALAVTCIYLFFRSFNRTASIGITVTLVLAIIFQSGNLLTRIDDTIESSSEIHAEEKLDPRLISWGVATEIMAEYPLFGVGVGNFINAFPKFSNTELHVAHNTYFQFSANCGIIAGLIYLWFFAIRIPTFRKSAAIEGSTEFPSGFKRDYLDDLLNSMFLGFFVVAVFLDLMIYELLYFLILLGFCKYTLDRTEARVNGTSSTKEIPEINGPVNSIYRFSRKATTNDNLRR
ncbi:hypothetical protein AB833_20595 [Chromatiales bacterium (ex Bugula neritina AB1)]|nr:hypothetical protein AB833_20595 [Chromatiales bacterium (ex Bugula neritina AB1)]